LRLCYGVLKKTTMMNWVTVNGVLSMCECAQNWKDSKRPSPLRCVIIDNRNTICT
jgi:hypothetical protein